MEYALEINNCNIPTIADKQQLSLVHTKYIIRIYKHAHRTHTHKPISHKCAFFVSFGFFFKTEAMEFACSKSEINNKKKTNVDNI